MPWLIHTTRWKVDLAGEKVLLSLHVRGHSFQVDRKASSVHVIVALPTHRPAVLDSCVLHLYPPLQSLTSPLQSSISASDLAQEIDVFREFLQASIGSSTCPPASVPVGMASSLFVRAPGQCCSWHVCSRSISSPTRGCCSCTSLLSVPTVSFSSWDLSHERANMQSFCPSHKNKTDKQTTTTTKNTSLFYSTAPLSPHLAHSFTLKFLKQKQTKKLSSLTSSVSPLVQQDSGSFCNNLQWYNNKHSFFFPVLVHVGWQALLGGSPPGGDPGNQSALPLWHLPAPHVASMVTTTWGAWAGPHRAFYGQAYLGLAHVILLTFLSLKSKSQGPNTTTGEAEKYSIPGHPGKGNGIHFYSAKSLRFGRFLLQSLILFILTNTEIGISFCHGIDLVGVLEMRKVDITHRRIRDLCT